MSARVSGRALLRIFLTTLAGISSRKSAASSAIRLSMMLEASLSESDWMIYCWSSNSRSAKTSAAILLGSIRNILRDSSSSISSITAAISAVCISAQVCRSFVYCLDSSSSRSKSSYSLFLSSILFSIPVHSSRRSYTVTGAISVTVHVSRMACACNDIIFARFFC